MEEARSRTREWLLWGFMALAVMLTAVSQLFSFRAGTGIAIGMAAASFLASGCALGLFAFHRARSMDSGSIGAFGFRFIGWHGFIWGLGASGKIVMGEFFSDLPFALQHVPLLCSYVTLFFGLGALSVMAPFRGRMQVLVDAVIAASSVAALSWRYAVTPLWSLPGTYTTRILLIGMPIGDTVALFTTILLGYSVFSVRAWRPSVFAALAGISLLVGGGFSCAMATGRGLSQASGIHVLLWPLGELALALACIMWVPMKLQRTDAKEELKARATGSSAYAALFAPYAVGLLSFSAIASDELRASGSVSGSTLVIGAFLTAMVVLRQAFTMQDNQLLTRKVSRFNSDLESMVERRTAQIQSLYSLARAVGNSLNVEGILDETVAHAKSALNADAVVVNLTPFAFSGHARVAEMVRHDGLEENLWVLDKLNILETPWAAIAGALHDEDFLRHAKYGIAPILCKGEVMGWTAVLRWKTPFDDTDLKLLEGVGTEMGTALENARLYEMARQMADIDPVTGLLNHRATQERFEFLFKHAEDTFEPMCVMMIDLDNFKFFNDTYGHLSGDRVLKTVARALRDSARPHDVVGRYGGDEFLFIMPDTQLSVAEEIALRVAAAVSDEGFPEPGSDRVIPIGVTVGAAAFPEQAKTRNELLYHADSRMFKAKKEAGPARKAARKPSRLSSESFDLLDSMVSAVDNKDYYTRSHSEEVAEYALWIGQELGLSEGALKVIRTAALLHDVGKIGIPDEILRKPGHLSDEEFEVMRAHPVVGAHMVSSIPGMGDIVPGVKYHHERWDGKGYPEGLAGENIPLLGRILAVPDAFSAMTTDRPYRKGMEWAIALEKIRAGIGTQFDPAVAAAFFRAIESRKSQLSQLAQSAVAA